jgi:hypothetical protein
MHMVRCIKYLMIIFYLFFILFKGKQVLKSLSYELNWKKRFYMLNVKIRVNLILFIFFNNRIL